LFGKLTSPVALGFVPKLMTTLGPTVTKFPEGMRLAILGFCAVLAGSKSPESRMVPSAVAVAFPA
jgi:hypothetical protein